MRTFKHIFSKTHELYFQNFVTFVSITIVPFIYNFLVNLHLSGMLGLSLYSIGFQLLHIAVIAPFIHFLSWMALTWATSEAYLERNASVIDSYRKVLSKRFFEMVFTYALMWIFVFIGFVFFLIPGIMLLVKYCFVPQVVIVEGLSGMKALRRSKDLTRNAFMKTLFYLSLFGLIEGIIANTLGFNDIAKYLGALLFTPLGTVFFTVYYYDRVGFGNPSSEL
jgi:hypothetical protein